MRAATMSTARLCVLGLVLGVTMSPEAGAQSANPPPSPPTPAARNQRTQPVRAREVVGVRGVGLVGAMKFTASDSFDAVLGSPVGVIYGGGAQVTIPGGLYVEVAAWRFSDEGTRVFVGPDDEVFPIGIPLRARVTPLELTAGWRFRNLFRRVVPHVGGGVNWYRYEETSDFAGSDEDLDERFTGFHVLGGVELRVHRWVGFIGEVAWSSVPDALTGGVAAAFGEDDLGGTSARLKIVVGR